MYIIHPLFQTIIIDILRDFVGCLFASLKNNYITIVCNHETNLRNFYLGI